MGDRIAFQLPSDNSWFLSFSGLGALVYAFFVVVVVLFCLYFGVFNILAILFWGFSEKSSDFFTYGFIGLIQMSGQYFMSVVQSEMSFLKIMLVHSILLSSATHLFFCPSCPSVVYFSILQIVYTFFLCSIFSLHTVTVQVWQTVVFLQRQLCVSFLLLNWFWTRCLFWIWLYRWWRD